MTVLFSRNAKCLLAMTVLGMLLAGCQRNTGSDAAPGANTGAPAAPAPDASAPPSPAPAAAPESSAASPGSVSSAASDMAAAAGGAVDDTVITTKVKAALVEDSEVKGTDIHVETSKGDVTLSGTVASQAQIDKAVGIARGIEGVKNVDNKLTAKAG